MKKKVFVAFAGALVIGSFVFSSLSFKPGSLHELKAKVQCECKWDGVLFPCHDDLNQQFAWGYRLECN